MRRLAAIMFTDLVGFTALMQEDEHRAKSTREREREDVDVSLHLDCASVYAAFGQSDKVMERSKGAAEMHIGALVFLGHHKSWGLAKGVGISEFPAEIGL